jgi:hypothetical protein
MTTAIANLANKGKEKIKTLTHLAKQTRSDGDHYARVVSDRNAKLGHASRHLKDATKETSADVIEQIDSLQKNTAAALYAAKLLKSKGTSSKSKLELKAEIKRFLIALDKHITNLVEKKTEVINNVSLSVGSLDYRTSKTVKRVSKNYEE